MDETRFVACARINRNKIRSSPHDTREAAAAELFALYPQLRRLSTCCSTGWPDFQPTREQVMSHEQPRVTSRLVNRNLITARGRTCMRLEPELWDALAEVCQRERRSMHELIREIDAERSEGTRTSAVRVFLLRYFRTAASVARS